MVCHVNEQGEIICGPTRLPVNVFTAQAQADLQAVLLPLMNSPAKVALVMQTAQKIWDSTLDDANIRLRADDVAESAEQLLTTDTPIILTYKHIALPGNILAAYLTQKANYAGAHKAVIEFTDDELTPLPAVPGAHQGRPYGQGSAA
jgi:hypothetical protein